MCMAISGGALVPLRWVNSWTWASPRWRSPCRPRASLSDGALAQIRKAPSRPRLIFNGYNRVGPNPISQLDPENDFFRG